MSDAITARQFHDSDGVEDWRVVLGTAQTRFRTGLFTAGVEPDRRDRRAWPRA